MKETEAAYIDLVIENIRELIVDRSRWRSHMEKWVTYAHSDDPRGRAAYDTASAQYEKTNKLIEAALIEMRK